MNRKVFRRGVSLLAAVLLLLCLWGFSGCSDQIYDPTQGTLILDEGTGNDAPTEAPTGSVIEIPDPDLFESAPHVLRADFLNTGDSDAILIRMDDAVILVDAGEADDYPTISRKLTEYGISTIDYFIISHYDNDHIGAAAQILQSYTVKTCICRIICGILLCTVA